MDLSHVAGVDTLLYGGGLTGLILAGLSVIRTIGMRASKDALTLREDGAQRDTITMLQRRIDVMDTRISILEISRNKLFTFSMSALSYIMQCNCSQDDSRRIELEQEFQKILAEENQFITSQSTLLPLG